MSLIASEPEPMPNTLRKLTIEKMSSIDGTCFEAAMHWIWSNFQTDIRYDLTIPSELKL